MAKKRVGIRNGALVTPSSGIITDGLVLNLDAGNTLSYPGTGIDWFDLTSNNNNGVLINGVSYLTENGGVMSFDSINDYVNFPNNNQNYSTSELTIEAFVKPFDGYGQFGRVLIGQGSNCTQASVYVLWGRASNRFELFAGDNTILRTNVLPENEWYHVVVIRNNNGSKIYINGVLNNSSTNSGFGNGNSTTLGIGEGLNCQVVSNWHGNIGLVRMYLNKSLTDSEVLQNYNATKGRFGL